MYNRKRIARGAGSALAVWALVGILLMSSGVAYGLPLAGVGGFVITSNSVTADSTVIYPGVDETSGFAATNPDTGATSNDYPQAVVELRDVSIENLGIKKTIPLSQYTADSLNGNAQIRVFAPGTSTSPNVLLKSSALGASSAQLNGFRVQDRGDGQPGDSYKTWANSTSTLGSNTGLVTIRGHYIVADRIQTSDSLAVVVCYDANPSARDGFEYGTGVCDYTDPVPGT